jgi:alpha-glucuronidase
VFACANWHAFGRLAWNPSLPSAALADEWLRMTFTNDAAFVEPVKTMMLSSRQAAVDYMTPLGLHHQMARGHHYGPGPWVTGGPRADWTSVYYNRADAQGLGFDRTATGTNAVSQYAGPVRDRFASLDRVGEDYLLWFHHVPWSYRMSSGNTLWNELAARYCRGVEAVRTMETAWRGLTRFVDSERFEETVRFSRSRRTKRSGGAMPACSTFRRSRSSRSHPMRAARRPTPSNTSCRSTSASCPVTSR